MTIELVCFWKTGQGSSPRFVSFECTDTSIRSDAIITSIHTKV